MKIRQVSRRIAYGFSFDETLLDEDNFIKNAKQQLESLPDFNPWQYIAEFNDPGMNIGGDDLSTDLKQKTELSLDKTQKKDIQRFLKKTTSRICKLSDAFLIKITMIEKRTIEEIFKMIALV